MKLELLSFVIWIRKEYTWFSVLYLLCISQVSTDELCLSSRCNINWRVPRPAHIFIGPAGQGSYSSGVLHYTLRHTLHHAPRMVDQLSRGKYDLSILHLNAQNRFCEIGNTAVFSHNGSINLYT